jgi:hypothetical protein
MARGNRAQALASRAQKVHIAETGRRASTAADDPRFQEIKRELIRKAVYDTREAARAAVQEFDAKHGTKYEAHLEASGDFESKHPRHPAGSGNKSGEFRAK